MAGIPGRFPGDANAVDASSNLGGIGLFIAVDNYIYNPTVFEAQGVKANTQNDIQIQFGLGVPLGGGSGK